MHYRSMEAWYRRVPFILGAVLFLGEVHCDPVDPHMEELPVQVPPTEATPAFSTQNAEAHMDFAHAVAASSDDGLSPLQEWLAK